MSGQQQQPRSMSSQPTILTTLSSVATADEPAESKSNQQDGKENKRPVLGEDQQLTSHKVDDDDDDNDQVIPSWPSKQEQLARNASSEFIQHKVYSLKDYSQVASPTATPPGPFQRPTVQQAASVSTGGGPGKLLKSMSQDRKVKSSSKRMSECIYPAGQMSVSQSLFNSAAGNKTEPVSLGQTLIGGAQTSSASFSLGQASNMNSLLPAAGRPSSQLAPAVATGNASLAGESRIDRMRKLFVSPLSLRSSASGGSTSIPTVAVAGLAHSGTPTNSTNTASGGPKQREPRLSFQASGGGKPGTAAHHLMHAMHRSAAGQTTAMAAGLAQAMAAAHHGRRSPMRQKQTQGFRVYGCPLQMANNIYPITCFGRADIYKQQAVPYVLARLCNYIEENSSQLTHEGIFRVSGNARLMDKLRTLFDHLGDAPLESESVDVATSASMLKMYLRELPEPLIPTRMNYYFITLAKKYAPFLSREQASSTSNALKQQQKHHQQKQQAASGGSSKTLASSSTTSVSTGADESVGSNSNNSSQCIRQRLAFSRDLTKLIRKLPIENYNLLKYLACFLYRISLKQQYNKMCSEALGIVFGPNVFRIRSESYKGLKEQELSNQIMASIISNYKLIFDSELTDPLGNVIDGTENALVAAAVAVSEAVEQQKRKQPPPPQPPQSLIDPADKSGPTEATSVATGTDLLAQAEMLARKADCMKASFVPIVAVATQSVPIDEKSQSIEGSSGARDTCCPDSCKDFMYDREIGQPPGFRANRVDGEDDDCDDDGEESYTPSSESGSYCSSMDSQTLESSYDGDREKKPRRSARLGGDLTSRSTSECASDTSYTPTSSHTDSDVHDDDYYEDEAEDDESSDDQQTSSRESSASINNRPPESQYVGDSTISGGYQGARSDCRVCKRRESLQITHLATVKGSNGCSPAPRPDEKTSNDIVDDEPQRRQMEPILISSTLAEPSLSDSQVEHDTLSQQQQQQQQQQRRESGARISRRRRQVSARLADGTGNSASRSRKSPVLELIDDAQTTSGTQLRSPPDQLMTLEQTVSTKEARQGRQPGDSSRTQRQANPLLRRRSSSASSLNGRSHRGLYGLHHPHSRQQVENNPNTLLVSLKNEMAASGTSKTRSKQTSATVVGNRKSKAAGMSRRQQEHHGWDSKRHSRHSMRTRNARQVAVPADASRSRRSRVLSGNEELAGGVACGLDLAEVQAAAESISLGAWREIFAKHLADEAACAAANYEESDSPARYFLMRSFNSDETLLRSYNYCSECPGGCQSNADNSSAKFGSDLEEGSQRQATASQRRRHSNLDFIAERPVTTLLPMVCGPFEQIFEALDLAEEAESPLSASEFSAEGDGNEKQHHQARREKNRDKSTTQQSLGTSTISLIDNKIGFRKSELSMNDLADQGNVLRSRRRGLSDDAILLQMEATKDLIKTLKRLLKLGRSRGFGQEMKQLLAKFASSEEGTNSICQSGEGCSQRGQQPSDWTAAYSDDCLACYVDHLSVRGFIEELDAIAIDDQRFTKSDSPIEIDTNGIERLCKILAVKITLFKQRYNDLKNTRDHYLQHHANGPLISALNSLTACYSQGQGIAEKTHGSLDTLRMQQKQLLQQEQEQQHTHVSDIGATTPGHRSRILSVPNRQLLAHLSSGGSVRSRSAMVNKQLDPMNILAETSISGNEDNPEEGKSETAGGNCKFGSLCPVEFVFNIEKQLALKRQLGKRLVKLNDMTAEQLQSEKLELQKNLLRYEHWFGRPVARLEFSLVGHLYERYRAVKLIKQRKALLQL